MTPKEKALELVARFDYLDITSGMKYQDSKICALICVEEILKNLKQDLEVSKDLHSHANGLVAGNIFIWQQVKTEIEKL